MTTNPNVIAAAAAAYVASHQLMEAALADGFNVHGAMASIIGAEGNLRAALAPAWQPVKPLGRLLIAPGLYWIVAPAYQNLAATPGMPLLGRLYGDLFHIIGWSYYIDRSQVTHIMPFNPPALPRA